MSQELKDVKVILAGLRKYASVPKLKDRIISHKSSHFLLPFKSAPSFLKAAELLAKYRYIDNNEGVDMYRLSVSQAYRNAYIQRTTVNNRFVELYLTPRGITTTFDNILKVGYVLKTGEILEATNQCCDYSVPHLARTLSTLFTHSVLKYKESNPNGKHDSRTCAIIGHTELYCAGYIELQDYTEFLIANGVTMSVFDFITLWYGSTSTEFINNSFLAVDKSKVDETTGITEPHEEYDPDEDNYDI